MQKRWFVLPMLIGICVFPRALAAQEESGGWRHYSYTGRGFLEGGKSAGPVIYIRNGFLPVIGSLNAPPTEDPLPAGTGALAGLSYVEKVGGKLKKGEGYIPLPGAMLVIGRRGWTMAVRTDDRGYFVLALRPGEYELTLLGASGRFRVAKGKSTLIAVRGGRRMVD